MKIINPKYKRRSMNSYTGIWNSLLKFSPLLIFISYFLIYLIFVNRIHAQIENFEININSTYKINEEGTAFSSNNVKITNKTPYNYTSAFDLNLQKIDDVRNIKAYNAGTRLQTTLKKDNSSTVVEINFGKRFYGENKSFDFNIEYETSQIAHKTGDFWEIYVPVFENIKQLADYNINIIVPDSFGKLSISKPAALHDSSSYKFTKNQISKAGIYLLFGSSQTYKIDLSYHLSNSNFFPINYDVAIPPSTNYQDIIIKSIMPPPIYVYEDLDGNWLAKYYLTPHQKLDISAQLFAIEKTIPDKGILLPDNKNMYLKEKKYWETGNDKIQKIIRENNSPEKIYNFTVANLIYDHNKIIGENQRLGAAKALMSPSSALCLEFTDLFITLSRAAKIPSRSVEGFAYSDNEKLIPLAILKDTLHTWAEYYDDRNLTWVMVDPTWGNTTGGSDYFNSMDLRHIAFVIRGAQSDYPIPPGGYKISPTTKDVYVKLANFNSYEEIKKESISDNLPKSHLSLLPLNFNVTVINLGNSQIKDKQIKITSDLLSDNVIVNTQTIPPYGQKTYAVKFESKPFFTNKNINITIQFDKIKYKKTVNLGLGNFLFYIAGGGIFGAVILFIAALKTRRIHF